jgi:hypothetical protein
MNMKLTGIPGTMIVVLALLLAPAQTVFAASTLTVSSVGNGVFTLQGTGMDGIAAMDIVLQYDATTLTNPRVESGGLIAGAMTAVNPNTPGIVRIAIIRTIPMAGSGDILSLTFDRTGASVGAIISLNARVVDINGKSLQSSVQITNTASTTVAGGDSSSRPAPSQPPTPTTAPQTPKTNTPPVIITGSIVPTDEATKPRQEENPDTPQEQTIPVQKPAQPKENREARAIVSEPVDQTRNDPRTYTEASVLERFREYKGARTPKAFMALFDREPMIGFRQEPRIGITSDSATVIVALVSMTTDTRGPGLTLTGAKLVSLTKDAKNTNTWIAKVQPGKGACVAGIGVPGRDILMEFPLTIAPRVDVDIDKSGRVAEKDFALFLKGPRGKNIKKYDMNGDGVLDYRDDYIFTANYIVARAQSKHAVNK